MTMTVASIMNNGFEYVDDAATLDHAARIMRDKEIVALPVRSAAGELAGVITDRDILGAVADHRDPEACTVADLAGPPPVFVKADDPIDIALQHMVGKKVRRALVLDGEHLVGTLSQTDLARSLPPEINGFIEQAMVGE